MAGDKPPMSETPPPTRAPLDDLGDRLERLEESHAFNERATERLSSMVEELSGLVHELTARIERAERLVERLRESPPPEVEHGTDGGEAPPDA